MSVRWTGPEDTCAAGNAPASLRSILTALATVAVVAVVGLALVLFAASVVGR